MSVHCFYYWAAWLPACLGVVAALTACSQRPPEQAAPAAAPDRTGQAQIERGRMLVLTGGCHDCHTPKILTPKGPEPDISRMLSGHPEGAGVPQPFKGDGGAWTTHANDHLTAWSGAWGVSFAANLTPDQNTGLGIWTEEMFLNAMKKGLHMGTSRPILPPMPWMWYAQLPDEDLKAIFAYLKSIPPIRNRVPAPLRPDGKPIDAPGGP